MQDKDVKPNQIAKPRAEQVKCRRTGQKLAPEEHAKCPYCFGQAADVAQGQHERFCDFVPGRDPVNFGFPPGTTRDREG